MTRKTTIEVQGAAIAVISHDETDFISLTDIARYRNSQEPFAVINNWMRSRSTIEFLGLWEKLSNPGFKPLEFERFNDVLIKSVRPEPVEGRLSQSVDCLWPAVHDSTSSPRTVGIFSFS
jgi:hypothetical protein